MFFGGLRVWIFEISKYPRTRRPAASYLLLCAPFIRVGPPRARLGVNAFIIRTERGASSIQLTAIRDRVNV